MYRLCLSEATASASLLMSIPNRRSSSMHRTTTMSILPNKVIKEYNLKEKVTHDGYVYVDVRHGVFGLPYAGLVIQELLKND